ncbi:MULTISPECIES: YihY/virulence factor BrkB family protein [unclassified Meridianimarinicoccus]|uniref:YihY/virulence factor BrkB family protein n=1 Tax=unclassified Meridianimarinicoccus TaxID=2923344 RepID=UPI001867BDD9|nr:YihY/virulence factor BrkB family protein [Fluviibacterium sp. MJW13]
MFARLKTIWAILKGMQKRIVAANLTLVAAGGAFFSMLSLFPGLAAVVTLLGLVANPAIVEQQLSIVADFVPKEAFDLIKDQVLRMSSSGSSTLGWATLVSILTALWSARLGTDAIIKALNAVHGTPMRSGLRTYAVALTITLVLILVVIVAILAMVVLPVILAFLPLGPFTGLALDTARWVLAVAVVFSGIWVLYRFAPTGQAAGVKWLNGGAVLSVLVWAGGTLAFSYFLRNFGKYNEVYGSIGAVIALLMFLYITILTVLLGAALNAELAALQKKKAQESLVSAPQKDPSSPSALGPPAQPDPQESPQS